MRFKPVQKLPPVTMIDPGDLQWFTEIMSVTEFTFAKTMPRVPHFYTNKHTDWEDPADYDRAARLILAHGTPEALWSFPIRRYLYAGPWRYWLMTTDPDQSYIMNRCDPTDPRYLGAIRPAIE